MTGTMPNRGSVTISPNTVSQEHDSGYYDSIKVNAVTNEIDTNIKSENIKKDISILGITGILEEGVDTSDADAAAANIEINKTAYVNGQKITGNIPLNNTSLVVDNAEISLDGENNKLEMNSTNSTKQIIDNNVNMKFNANYSDVATTIGLTPDKIKRGETILNVAGNVQEGIDTSNANAVETDILSGKTAYVDGNKITGTITSKEAQTYIPSSSEQIIDAGQYLSGTQTISAVPTEEKTITPSALSQEITPTENKFLSKVTVSGDANLTVENVKSGVTIFGVEGSYTSDANAMAEDIAMNKTAYINGQKITGTLPLFPNSRTFTVDNAGVADNIEDSELEFTTINTAKQILDSNLNMKFSAPYSDIITAIGLTADKLISGNTILGIEGTATTGIDTSDATATADDIVVNKTAYANGQKITGTIPTATTITEDGSVQLESDGRFRAGATVPNNIYLHSDETPRMIWLNLTKSQVAETIGLTADKIVSGNTILDVAGTASIGITPDTTIQNGEYGLETATSGELDNDIGIKLFTNANTQSKLYENGSIVEIHITNELLAQILGITADKIKSGETICGIEGTYTGDVESV